MLIMVLCPTLGLTVCVCVCTLSVARVRCQAHRYYNQNILYDMVPLPLELSQPLLICLAVSDGVQHLLSLNAPLVYSRPGPYVQG